jgi:hypothetical protein
MIARMGTLHFCRMEVLVESCPDGEVREAVEA